MLNELDIPEVWHDPNAVNYFHQQVVDLRGNCGYVIQQIQQIDVTNEDVYVVITGVEVVVSECIPICDRILNTMSMPSYSIRLVEELSEYVNSKVTMILRELNNVYSGIAPRVMGMNPMSPYNQPR